jgi:hypothetical protein
MSKNEALKLALEALELSSVTVDSFGVQRKTQEAITAIKQALATPQALPDVLTQEYGDSAQYVEGWNECREATIKRLKAELKARGNK